MSWPILVPLKDDRLTGEDYREEVDAYIRGCVDDDLEYGIDLLLRQRIVDPWWMVDDALVMVLRPPIRVSQMTFEPLVESGEIVEGPLRKELEAAAKDIAVTLHHRLRWEIHDAAFSPATLPRDVLQAQFGCSP